MQIVLILLVSTLLAADIFWNDFKSCRCGLKTKGRVFDIIKLVLLIVIYIIITILLIRKYHFILLGLLYAGMLSVLFVISFLDARNRQISKKGFEILMLGGLAVIAANQDISIISGLAAMFSVYAVLWIICRFSKAGIGMGDVRLCAVIAIYLGAEDAFGMLMMATFMCGISALMLTLFDRSYRNESIPFAPFITAGTAAVLLL